MDGTQVLNNVHVASMSAANTPSSGQRTVYLTDSATNAHNRGTAFIVPITALHTVKFTTQTSVPSGGKIILTFPGSSNNTASPSATTFAFNNLQTSSVVSEPSTACNSVTVSSPTITCTTSASVPAGTAVTVLVGCSAQSGGSCTTQVPTLINPAKSANAGTADVWKLGIKTTDSGGVTLDQSTVSMGTIESVTVRATVDPTLTFSIAGINNGTALGSINTGCTQLDTTNSGINSTATDISLGILSAPPSINTQLNNLAAQSLTITTNSANGYSLTATSSGPLRNASLGFDLANNSTPQAFPASTNFSGIHACGLDTTLTTWNSTASSACTTDVTGSSDPICLYGWPTQTTPLTIASRSTGPVGNVVTAGSGQTIISYAATTDVRVPPGEYKGVITYTATPSF
jgi:hypothetical protein